MTAKEELDKRVYEDHRSVIMRAPKGALLSLLDAKDIPDYNRLWLAVGYFWHGAGTTTDRSFIPHDEWARLLIATDRYEPVGFKEYLKVV